MRKVDAVYEGGVLRPTEKLLLEEHQLVTVILVDDETAEQDIQFEPKHCFEPLANRSIKRETVRGALSKIPGSLDADFAAERNERQVLGYFIDTSALAKLYHVEVGSQLMEMLAQSPDNRLIVSQLSVIELQSVFATKVRMGVIESASLDQLRGLFFADLADGRFKVVLVSGRYFRGADRLIRSYAVSRSLRTLDALQLAVALELQRWRRHGVGRFGQKPVRSVRQWKACKSLTPFKARRQAAHPLRPADRLALALASSHNHSLA